MITGEVKGFKRRKTRPIEPFGLQFGREHHPHPGRCWQTYGPPLQCCCPTYPAGPGGGRLCLGQPAQQLPASTGAAGRVHSRSGSHGGEARGPEVPPRLSPGLSNARTPGIPTTGQLIIFIPNNLGANFPTPRATAMSQMCNLSWFCPMKSATDTLSQQDLQSQQVKIGPAIHLPFQKLQPVHVPLCCAIAPGLPNGLIYSCFVTL